MKQLLIVSDSTIDHGLTAGSSPNTGRNKASDFSGLYNGAISFFELGAQFTVNADNPASNNFGIALGRPNGQMPFIIPEVDIKSLSIVKSSPVAATTFNATFIVPDPDDVTELIPGTSRVLSPLCDYSIIFVKKGTVPHERNTWTVHVVTAVDTAEGLRDALIAAVEAKKSEQFPFKAEKATTTASDDSVKLTCLNEGEQWDIKFADCLEPLNATPVYTDADTYTMGSKVTVNLGMPAIGDKKDIQDLASRCAAGKGFTDTYRDGDTVYPNYPEPVADTTYVVYTLRFRVGRDSAKTRDERVWQTVHIAVPSGNTSQIAALDAILPVGKYTDAMTTAGANAAITKAISGTSTTAGLINAAIEDDDSDLYKAIDASFAEDQA